VIGGRANPRPQDVRLRGVVRDEPSFFSFHEPQIRGISLHLPLCNSPSPRCSRPVRHLPKIDRSVGCSTVKSGKRRPARFLFKLPDPRCERSISRPPPAPVAPRLDGRPEFSPEFLEGTIYKGATPRRTNRGSERETDTTPRASSLHSYNNLMINFPANFAPFLSTAPDLSPVTPSPHKNAGAHLCRIRRTSHGDLWELESPFPCSVLGS